MGEEPLFDSARKVLQKQLEQTRRHAVDKRTETWVARESKRLEAERKRAAEQMDMIGQRQQLLDKEIEDVAKLRSNLSVETEPKEEEDSEEADADMTATAGAAAAEIEVLAARELEMRRWHGSKRKPDSVVDLTAEELVQMYAEANTLQVLQQQKRRKIEADLAAHSQIA